MAIVRDMITEFAKRGIVAEWSSESGGCYSVRIDFGDRYTWKNGETFSPFEILISTQEGAFGYDDVNRDSEIMGFQATLYVYGEDWERVTDMGFDLYSSPYGLISERAYDEMLADGNAPDEIPATPDLQAEMLACVERVTFYAFKVAFAHRNGRTGETENPEPEVVRVKRKNGIAGQFQMVADVQYGETTPAPVTFVGSTYGGPVVMVDSNGMQHFVTNPDRFGDFATDAEEWVYRFFDTTSKLPR